MLNTLLRGLLGNLVWLIRVASQPFLAAADRSIEALVKLLVFVGQLVPSAVLPRCVRRELVAPPEPSIPSCSAWSKVVSKDA